MLEFVNGEISSIIRHFVGSDDEEDISILAENAIQNSNIGLQNRLLGLFQKVFSEAERFVFQSNDGENLTSNEAYLLSQQAFEDESSFVEISQALAENFQSQSFEVPNYKPGDFWMMSISGVQLENNPDPVRALVCFKIDQKHAFMQVDEDEEQDSIRLVEGISLDKLEQGCVIFGHNEDAGFDIAIIEKTSQKKIGFWKNHFLHAAPRNDDYHQTKDFLTATKSFVLERFPNEFEVSKADQIDMLNKSVDFFKTNDSFDKNRFEETVFQDPNVISAFENFEEDYSQKNEVTFSEAFDISPTAVKHQSRVFKSVLKLDKNFHVYIHGKKDLIERGVEDDGRKFYKLYYDEEH